MDCGRYLEFSEERGRYKDWLAARTGLFAFAPASLRCCVLGSTVFATHAFVALGQGCRAAQACSCSLTLLHATPLAGVVQLKALRAALGAGGVGLGTRITTAGSDAGELFSFRAFEVFFVSRFFGFWV